MASSRKTYDTDVITLRTVFAKNIVNSNIPALRVLTADGAGGTYWAIPSSLGQNPAFNEIITSAGTYTADLSYNRFRLLAGQGVGMVDGPAGSNETTLFGKGFLEVDVSGENAFYSFSNNTLTPNIRIATTGVIQARADPATNTLFIDGPVSNPYIVSTGQYGFYQIKVTPEASTITSSVQGWGGDFITANSPSTLFRLIGNNDIKLSTNVTTNSIFFTISTFTSKGYLDISAAAFGAYPSTLSTVSSIYVQNNTFISTIFSLSTQAVQWSSVQSSIDALAISTGDNFFLLTGLINARATIVQLNSEIATVNANIRSTVQGLGSSGYISSMSLASSIISTTNFISESFSSFSSSIGDVTTNNLLSTVKNLGSLGYLSTTAPYLSSFTVSTGSIETSSLITSSLLNYGTLSTHSLVVYGASTLRVQGLSFFENILSSYSIVSGRVGILDSSTGNPIFIDANNGSLLLGGSPAVTQTILDETFVSTVAGLGTDGYLSSLTGFQVSTGFVKASTVQLLDIETNDINNLYVSGQTLLLNGNFITGGAGGGGGGGVSKILAGGNITISPLAGIGDVTITTNVTAFGSLGYVSTASLTSSLISTTNFVSLSFSSFSSASAASLTSSLISTTNFVSLSFSSFSSASATANIANLVSTVQGLGTTGYISSLSLTSSIVSTTTGLQYEFQTSGFLSSQNLLSTVEGLASIGYISSASLTSSFISTNEEISLSFSSFSTGFNTELSVNFISTVIGLGSVGYISTAGGTGDVTTVDLTSTVIGLGSVGYISTAGGGGGGGGDVPFLSSFSLSTGLIFASSITSYVVSTVNIYAATLNMSVLFI